MSLQWGGHKVHREFGGENYRKASNQMTKKELDGWITVKMNLKETYCVDGS
jgi:hypothetical protein